MVDRDFTFGAITVRLGNCATWCGRMVQPASGAGVQLLSITYSTPGTGWQEINPRNRSADIAGSGTVPIGTWLHARDSFVAFFRRNPSPSGYSYNDDAIAINVVSYALDPADELRRIAPSPIGDPNTNAAVAAHRDADLRFDNGTIDSLPSIIDLDVLAPVAGWPSWANARPTMATCLGWFAGFCGEMWTPGYDVAHHTPQLQNEGYGRTVSYRTAIGMLMALSTEDSAERRELCRRIAQWGVDLYGSWLDGRDDKVDGGHYQGRKALVVWAGHFLEQSWVDCSPLFPGKFHEDEQYYTASPAWVFGWPYGYKGNSDSPTNIASSIASWGAHYPTMFYLCGYFQHCCGTNVGQALAMRLIGRTAEMGVAHDGMMAQWMQGPDAATLAAIDAIVVTAVNQYTGQVYSGHPRNIAWGTSFASNNSGDGYDRFAAAAWTVYSDYAAPAGGPEIEVAGLANSILDGDSTPTVVDGTDFGTIQQGQATVTRSFVVTNIGDDNLVITSVTVPTGFTNTGPSSGTLPPGGAAVLTVRLDSSVVGAKTGQVAIASNDSDEATFNFSIAGTVNAPPTFPNIQVTGNGGNFSAVIVDGDATPSATDGTAFGTATQNATPVSRTFNVANAGDANLLVSSVTVPAGFTVTTALPATIQPGQAFPLVVRLDVVSVGAKTGQVVITTNDPDTPVYNFAISGTVAAPPSIPDVTMPGLTNGIGAPAVGDPRHFGSVVAGSASSVSRSFTVLNAGDGTLTIDAVTVPTGFTLESSVPVAVPAVASWQLVVRLTPATVGAKAGDVAISSNDPLEAVFRFAIAGEVLASVGGGGDAPGNPIRLGREDLLIPAAPGPVLRPRFR